MDIKKLQTAVVDALEDVKAQDIKIYDTTHLTSLFDRVAIASGTSNRQTKALAASVRDKVKAKGGHVVSVEGEDTGEWVLVDLGDMIVHIMQAPIRAYYRLEEIWGDKPVKLGAAKRKGTKEAEEAEPKKISSHLAAGKKAVAATPVVEKKAAVRKPAAAKTTATAATKKAAAKPAAVPAGKKVKVGAPKATVAAVAAVKAAKAANPRAAKPKADEAPAKTVIKRIKKPAAE
jgi:ribosome-associated protein